MNPPPPARRPLPAWLRLLPLTLGVIAAALPAAAEYPFSLEPERARYLLGEPVYLLMRGTRDRPPALEGNTLILSIRSPDGSEHAYRPPLRYRANPAASAGARSPRYARLMAEAGGGWVFPAPGRYILRLRARAGAQVPGNAGLSREAPALSDTVSLEIAAPSSPGDRRAFALLARAPGEYALAVYLEGGDQFRAGMAILRELAAFPNAYARAAALALSSDWSQDFRGASGGTPRRMDLARALAFARWDREGGAYPALRTAYRIGQAIALQSSRDPDEPALSAARQSLAAFRASLTPEERVLLDSF